MSTGVATYYDRLGRWNRFARVFGYGGGRRTLTVHRALADPSAQGRPTVTRLHDVLLDHLPSLDAPRVLDAGCGLGGTMFALVEVAGATCVGLTLSRSQAAAANAAAMDSHMGAGARAAHTCGAGALPAAHRAPGGPSGILRPPTDAHQP